MASQRRKRIDGAEPDSYWLDAKTGELAAVIEHLDQVLLAGQSVAVSDQRQERPGWFVPQVDDVIGAGVDQLDPVEGDVCRRPADHRSYQPRSLPGLSRHAPAGHATWEANVPILDLIAPWTWAWRSPPRGSCWPTPRRRGPQVAHGGADEQGDEPGAHPPGSGGRVGEWAREGGRALRQDDAPKPA